MYLFSILLTIIVPIFFIVTLAHLETYHTIRLPIVIMAFVWGSVSFFLSRQIEQLIVQTAMVDTFTLISFIAPIFEESIRSVAIIVMYVFVLVRYSGDAMIYGLAVGSGFAIMENLLYINIELVNEIAATGTVNPNVLLGNTLVRIVSTGFLHAGIAAIVASLVSGIVYYRNWGAFGLALIILLGAIMVHSAYNVIVWIEHGGLSFVVSIFIGVTTIVSLIALLNYNIQHEYNQIVSELHYDPSRAFTHKLDNGLTVLEHIKRDHGKKQMKLVEKYLIQEGQIAVYVEHLDNGNYRPRAIRSLRRAIAADLRRAHRILERMTPEVKHELRAVGLINPISLL